jgi:ethanolamine utilization protein EutA (predicted chaperonin)
VWFPDDVQHLQALSALAGRWVLPSARRHLTPVAAGRPAGDGRDPSPSSRTGPVLTR